MDVFVYIIKSMKFDKFYIGQTDNVESRLIVHNGPRAKWTKRYQPWKLVNTEKYSSRSEAMKREKYLKSLKNIGRCLEDVKAGKI